MESIGTESTGTERKTPMERKEILARQIMISIWKTMP